MEIKMDPELKSNWIEALRSGGYSQAEGVLYEGRDTDDKPKMCCLGVLEHVCGNGFHVFTSDTYVDDDGDCQRIQHMPDDLGDARKSPKDVLKQPCKGKRFDGEEFEYEGELEGYLAHMNDYGMNFEGIADYIEENL
jgi:hypothetical protein